MKIGEALSEIKVKEAEIEELTSQIEVCMNKKLTKLNDSDKITQSDVDIFETTQMTEVASIKVKLANLLNEIMELRSLVLKKNSEVGNDVRLAEISLLKKTIKRLESLTENRRLFEREDKSKFNINVDIKQLSKNRRKLEAQVNFINLTTEL